MSDRVLAGRYRLVEMIGQGGMAIVYRAIDLRTGHNVAVKILRHEYNQDAEFVGRFQREAEAASKMTHHNIVNLLDVGMEGDNRYLVMEYVQGKTLKQIITEKGRLSPEVAAQITIRILSALQHAHQRGIIHRDIKPQNILIAEDGHVKVADFGIARMANTATLTKGDNVMGSVHYFSPEQASGQPAGVTSDIYSCGVTLYEMLTGRVPFDGDSPVAIAMQHLHAQPAPIESIAPGVPQAITHVCMMAMEKNPKYRYQSATEMAAELRMALEGRVSQMRPRVVVGEPAAPGAAGAPQRNPQLSRSHTGEHGAQRRRPNRRLILITALVALVAVAGIFFGARSIINRVVNAVTVPYLNAMDVATAERTAQRAGLKVEIIEINHPTVAEGTVFLQSPDADTTLRRGDTVILTVSTGPATLQVPSVTGATTADAISALATYGLTLSVTERVVSASTAADLILTQSPEAGSPCAKGDIIEVTVSGGAVSVPNLAGMTAAEAQDALTAAQLLMLPTLQYEETEDRSLHGRVAAQQPAADTQVILNSSVQLTLYQVPEMMHTASLTLDLPESDTLLNVRITLMIGESEYTVYQGEFPANASRHPEVEIRAQEAGEYTYRVYIGGEMKYKQQVVLE